jgi:hypothetical protein
MTLYFLQRQKQIQMQAKKDLLSVTSVKVHEAKLHSAYNIFSLILLRLGRFWKSFNDKLQFVIRSTFTVLQLFLYKPLFKKKSFNIDLKVICNNYNLGRCESRGN